MEALPIGTISRSLADTVPDVDLMSVEGYLKIMHKFLHAHQAYLEAGLDQAAIEFIYPRPMVKFIPAKPNIMAMRNSITENSKPLK